MVKRSCSQERLGSLGHLFLWRVGLGLGKTLSGSYLLPSSDIVFIRKSKILGFCLTPAFTQFIISPSRTNPEGSLCCPILYLVYFPQDMDHFHCGCSFSLALLWTRRQGRAEWVRLLICSRWHHPQLLTLRKLSALWPQGLPLPRAAGVWRLHTQR